jgi:hypothetical protein
VYLVVLAVVMVHVVVLHGLGPVEQRVEDGIAGKADDVVNLTD